MNTTLARSLEVGGSACSGMRQKPRIEVASWWQPEQWAEPSEASQKVKLPQRHCQNSGSGFAGGLNSTTDMAFSSPHGGWRSGAGAPANRLIAGGKGAAGLVNRGLTGRFLPPANRGGASRPGPRPGGMRAGAQILPARGSA